MRGTRLALPCDPDPVDRVRLSHLALIRFRLETAARVFEKLAAGSDHPLVETGRQRLHTATETLMRAAGGLSGWTRTWIGTAALGSAAWAVALLCGQVVALPHGWRVAITVVAVMSLMWPVQVLTNGLARWINRRRTEYAGTPIELGFAADSPAEALVLLRMAHTGLAEATRRRVAGHRFGQSTATVAGFDWLRRRDPQLYWINQTDRHLCTAICLIERWLATAVTGQ